MDSYKNAPRGTMETHLAWQMAIVQEFAKQAGIVHEHLAVQGKTEALFLINMKAPDHFRLQTNRQIACGGEEYFCPEGTQNLACAFS